MTSAPHDQPTPSQQDPARPAGFTLSNFQVRYITALVLIPVVLAAAYAGGGWWLALVLVITLVGALEFYSMARELGGSPLTGVPMALAIPAVYYAEATPLAAVLILGGCAITWTLNRTQRSRAVLATLVTLAGVVYVGLPTGFAVAIRGLPDGFHWLVVVMGVTAGTDTFAYFGGRLWGRRKLAPRLSPKKTVEGAIAGLLGGFLLGLVFLLFADKLSWAAAGLVAAAPVAATLGDLLESAMKRAVGVKDSHIAGLNVIPGHGGVLDRIDSLILVVTLFYLALATGLVR